MASPSQRTSRRRQIKRRKMGKERRRKLSKNPPRTLPLDEAPSGEQLRGKREKS